MYLLSSKQNTNSVGCSTAGYLEVLQSIKLNEKKEDRGSRLHNHTCTEGKIIWTGALSGGESKGSEPDISECTSVCLYNLVV